MQRQKPKLYARLRRMDQLALGWRIKHAAYLPLVLRDGRTRSTTSTIALERAQRMLVLVMGLHGTTSPLTLLDYIVLRLVARETTKRSRQLTLARCDKEVS